VTVLRHIANNYSAKLHIANSCSAYCRIANTYCALYHMADILFCLTRPAKNGLKQGDALTPLLFNCPLEYAVRRVQVNQDGVQVNGTHQLWFMMMMLICWEEVYML
jgi:hypothetical protein